MLTTVVILAALAAGGSAQLREPGLELGVTRFFLPATGETQVLTMAGIPYLFAAPIGTGADAHISYTVTVRIVDDRGMVLTSESFQRTAPAAARIAGAAGVEQFRFLLKPGSFVMHISARDSLTGRMIADSARLEAFTTAPTASDLMIANEMRILDLGDTTSLPGEVVRANFRMRTAPVVRVDIVNSNMAFMLEAYAPSQTMGELRLSVRKRDGATVADFPPTKQQVPAGGGLFKGQFSLEGLPDGDYLLHATLLMDGKSATSQTPFVVSPAEEALARSVAIAQANRGTDEGYFNALPDDSLDAAAEVLYLTGAPSRELNVYKQEMSLAAKRRFMIEFWATRDRNKATVINEDRIAFYQAIANVNRLYGERGRVGWKTDRGRVAVKFGSPPSEILARPSDGRAPPYEVWRYTTGKPVWFIFADRGNQGNFVLLKSNELKEPGSAPGWLDILTPEVADEVGRWLGVNLSNVP